MPRSEFLEGGLGLLKRPADFFTVVTFLYAVGTATFFGLRFEPLGLFFGAVVLQLLGKRIKDLFEKLVPYLLFVVAYDAVRYGRDAFLRSDRVTVCGIR